MSGAGEPALTFYRSRGHIRIDKDNECALVCSDLGPVMHVWQTLGLSFTKDQAREFAALLTEWADK